jgi:hypothetical protein
MVRLDAGSMHKTTHSHARRSAAPQNGGLTGRRHKIMPKETKTKLLEGLGSMLCAPIPDALRSNRLIRADNTIDGITLKQLSTGIL